MPEHFEINRKVLGKSVGKSYYFLKVTCGMNRFCTFSVIASFKIHNLVYVRKTKWFEVHKIIYLGLKKFSRIEA